MNLKEERNVLKLEDGKIIEQKKEVKIIKNYFKN